MIRYFSSPVIRSRTVAPRQADQRIVKTFDQVCNSLNHPAQGGSEKSIIGVKYNEQSPRDSIAKKVRRR